MNLRILLPFGVFAEKSDVMRVVADTTDGSYGLLPNRLDCVAALVPGILTYETKDSGTVYVGIDQGVLVKAGSMVTVSVRRAIGGSDLEQLKDAVERDFLKLDEQERNVRNAVARARRLERFLTQPFFTTEQFSGMKGKLVSLKDSLDGCERILRDEFKDYPESALYMIGAIGEAKKPDQPEAKKPEAKLPEAKRPATKNPSESKPENQKTNSHQQAASASSHES